MRSLQITIDARDPDALARFWCEVLSYEMESPPAGFTSWEAFLEHVGVPREDWGSRSAARDPARKGPRLFFQWVSELTPSSRLHLDVDVGGGPGVPLASRRKRIEVEAERLVALGAQIKRRVERADEFWLVLMDPEGNAFCLQ